MNDIRKVCQLFYNSSDKKKTTMFLNLRDCFDVMNMQILTNYTHA